VKDANLGLRFLIEVTALVIFAYWGWKAGNGAMRWAIAIGAVAAAVVVWALFVSEDPMIAIPRPLQFVIELAVLAAAGAALSAAGHAPLAVAFVGVAVASGVLNYVWE
jgi:Protein of unknown function (DUF2568)